MSVTLTESLSLSLMSVIDSHSCSIESCVSVARLPTRRVSSFTESGCAGGEERVIDCSQRGDLLERVELRVAVFVVVVLSLEGFWSLKLASEGHRQK